MYNRYRKNIFKILLNKTRKACGKLDTVRYYCEVREHLASIQLLHKSFFNVMITSVNFQSIRSTFSDRFYNIVLSTTVSNNLKTVQLQFYNFHSIQSRNAIPADQYLSLSIIIYHYLSYRTKAIT